MRPLRDLINQEPLDAAEEAVMRIMIRSNFFSVLKDGIYGFVYIFDDSDYALGEAAWEECARVFREDGSKCGLYPDKFVLCTPETIADLDKIGSTYRDVYHNVYNIE